MLHYLKRVAAYQIGRISNPRLMFHLRESIPYAYAIGFYERATLGDCFGRTHEENMDWNEAYDQGANLADRLVGERQA